jgi:hypothetical protein
MASQFLAVGILALVNLCHPHFPSPILLKRILKQYEEHSGEIQIPQGHIDRHHITPEEWA